MNTSDSEVDLRVTLAGIELANPIMTASGCWDELVQRVLEAADPVYRPGAIELKTVKLGPVLGNPAPRAYDTGLLSMLNAIGLAGDGIDVFLMEKLPVLKGFGIPLIANISGTSVEEYAELTRRLQGSGIVAITANISCPNVEAHMLFGQDPKLTFELVSALRQETDLSLIVKLTPNVTDIAGIARAAEEAGADAISAINTVLAMAINIETGRPVLGSKAGMGGMSGPAIRPIAVRCVYEVCQAVKIPVIGIGGISTAQDAIQFFMAGATAVAVGTACFKNPLVISEIIEGLTKWLKEKGLSRVSDIPRVAIPGRS